MKSTFKKYYSWCLLVSVFLFLFGCSNGGGTSSKLNNLATTKSIIQYSLPSNNGSVKGVIIGQNITITVPFGTDITGLTATFTTNGESVTVGGIAQTSGITSNDFTNPVSYVVTAADGTTATYTVTVTVALNDAKAITSYKLNGMSGVITGQNIAVTVPFGTNITALVEQRLEQMVKV